MWIDVYDTTGTTKQGSGPITTATRWRSTPRLDRAGDFSFTMPAGDAQAALLTAKRVVKCYRATDDGPALVGAGIVQQKRVTTGAAGAMLEVSGCDLLGMLATKTVGDLGLYTSTTSNPSRADQLGVGALAGNTRTISDSDWIYIADDITYESVTFTLGASVNNNASSWAYFQYYTDSYKTPSGVVGGWVGLDITADGTINAGAVLGKTGTITFQPPDDWDAINLDGVTGYYLRMRPNTSLDAVAFTTVQVTSKFPTAAALATIDDYFPAGWAWDTTTSGSYGTTTATVYATFSGESVLAACVKVAELTGEHFRLSTRANEVSWLRAGGTASGLRAIRAGELVGADGNHTLCYITDISQEEDAWELVTRLYPHGGDSGANRPTLADVTDAAPAGCTRSTANNYLQHNTGFAAYGLIEKGDWHTPEVLARDATDTQRANASNQLQKAAWSWLGKHAAPQYFYRLSVVGLDGSLLPGQTIRVVYHEWVDGYHAVNIDTDLWVIAATHEVTADDRLHTTALEVATVDAQPKGDSTVLAERTDKARVSVAASAPVHGVSSAGAGAVTNVVIQDGQIRTVNRVTIDSSAASWNGAPSTISDMVVVDGHIVSIS